MAYTHEPGLDQPLVGLGRNVRGGTRPRLQVARLVGEKAQAEGISLNQAVIRVLEAQLGGRARADAMHHDLDELVGAWSEGEAAAFERTLAEQRRVDPELWR